MSRKLNNILVTGGAGFIGSNFIHYLFGLSTAEGNLFDDAKAKKEAEVLKANIKGK